MAVRREKRLGKRSKVWENVYSSALYSIPLLLLTTSLCWDLYISRLVAGAPVGSAAAAASTAYTGGSTTPGTARPSRHDLPSIYGVRGVEVKEGLKREQGRG
ncbi:hypothetical protein KQX54_017299 [Cotesia glomerata]|uniref:Uncharacterized protein n=1 Tax=Cotesia glomerata TaxID=32391 RepID=A0AAV7I3M8_COTGL|nr:hypothetical protein KQX54_017299 [Cotesia glomerata]